MPPNRHKKKCPQCGADVPVGKTNEVRCPNCRQKLKYSPGTRPRPQDESRPDPGKSQTAAADAGSLAEENSPIHVASEKASAPSRIIAWVSTRFTGLSTLLLSISPFLTLLGIVAVLGIQWWGPMRAAERLQMLHTQLERLAENQPEPEEASQEAWAESVEGLRSEIGGLYQLGFDTDSRQKALLNQLETRVLEFEKSHGQALEQATGAITTRLESQAEEAQQRHHSLQTAHQKERRELADQVAGLAGKTTELQAHLDRLSQSLQIPPDDQLSAVLIVLDTGQQLDDFGHHDVYRAIFQAVRHSLQYSPRRPLGVLANRGGRTRTLLPLGTHLADQVLEPFRLLLDENSPAAGEESDRYVGLQGALNLVATRELPFRLVYVTCNPLHDTRPLAGKAEDLLEQLKRLQAEVWCIHLVREGDPLQAELVQLSIQTGGQHTALLANRDGSRLPEGYSTRLRLLDLLCQSLALPVPVGPGR